MSEMSMRERENQYIVNHFSDTIGQPLGPTTAFVEVEGKYDDADGSEKTVKYLKQVVIKDADPVDINEDPYIKRPMGDRFADLRSERGRARLAAVLDSVDDEEAKERLLRVDEFKDWGALFAAESDKEKFAPKSKPESSDSSDSSHTL